MKKQSIILFSLLILFSCKKVDRNVEQGKSSSAFISESIGREPDLVILDSVYGWTDPPAPAGLAAQAPHILSNVLVTHDMALRFGFPEGEIVKLARIICPIANLPRQSNSTVVINGQTVNTTPYHWNNTENDWSGADWVLPLSSGTYIPELQSYAFYGIIKQSVYVNGELVGVQHDANGNYISGYYNKVVYEFRDAGLYEPTYNDLFERERLVRYYGNDTLSLHPGYNDTYFNFSIIPEGNITATYVGEVNYQYQNGSRKFTECESCYDNNFAKVTFIVSGDNAILSNPSWVVNLPKAVTNLTASLHKASRTATVRWQGKSGEYKITRTMTKANGSSQVDELGKTYNLYIENTLPNNYNGFKKISYTVTPVNPGVGAGQSSTVDLK